LTSPLPLPYTFVVEPGYELGAPSKLKAESSKLEAGSSKLKADQTENIGISKFMSSWQRNGRNGFWV
jgi:hypothetical protein